MAAYEVLLLNTAIPQIQAAQSGDTYVVPRDIAFNAGVTVGDASGDAFTINSSAVSTPNGLNFDSNTFVIDAANDRVGIGVASPGVKLDVVQAQNAQSAVKITNSNAGAAAEATFIATDGSKTAAFGIAGSAKSAFGALLATDAYIYNDSNAANTGITLMAVNGVIKFASGGNAEKMRLDSSGNLGLGVTPGTAFDIGGRGNSTNIQTRILTINAAGSSTRFQTTVNADTGFVTFASDVGGNGSGRGFAFNVQATQAMTLDASGNLQVGTTTSGGKLTVDINEAIAGGVAGLIAKPALSLTNAANYGYGVGILFRAPLANGGAILNNAGIWGNWSSDNNAYLGFATYGSGALTERARITSGGDFLVATETASASDTSNGTVLSSTGGYIISRRVSGSAQTHIQFVNGGTTVGDISTSTTNTTYATSSDYRLKDNQQPLIGSGAFIDALQPKTWNWKSNGSKGVGFIAHEVQAVSPGTVVGEKDAVDADGKPIMQAMEYGSAEFIANIIAELQSLRARVKALEGA